MSGDEEDYTSEASLLQDLEPDYLNREETSGPTTEGEVPDELADLLDEQDGYNEEPKSSPDLDPEDDEAKEESEPGDSDEDAEEVDEGDDNGEDAEPRDSAEELRAKYEELQRARQEESVFTELGRRLAYNQVQGGNAQPQGQAQQKGVDPDVQQALVVILDPNLTAEQKREELGGFSAKAREEAVAAFRKNRARLAEIVADPEGYEARIVAAAKQQFDNRLAQLEQQQRLEGMLARNRITDPGDVRFFLQKLAAGVPEGDALTLLRAHRKGPSLKRKEDRIKAKERDQRAVRRAQRGKGRSKPTKGRRRPKPQDLESMSPEDLADFAQEYLEKGGDPQDLMPRGY